MANEFIERGQPPTPDTNRQPNGQSPDTPRPFGELLRSHMTERGLTQTALAKGVHRSQSYISQLISGDRRPTLRTVNSLADQLDLTEAETSELLAYIPPKVSLEKRRPSRRTLEALLREIKQREKLADRQVLVLGRYTQILERRYASLNEELGNIRALCDRLNSLIDENESRNS